MVLEIACNWLPAIAAVAMTWVAWGKQTSQKRALFATIAISSLLATSYGDHLSVLRRTEAERREQLGRESIEYMKGQIDALVHQGKPEEETKRIKLLSKTFQSVITGIAGATSMTPDLGDIRSQLQRLNDETTPRILSVESRRCLSSSIAPPDNDVAITVAGGDREANEYAWEIASALDASGWRITNTTNTLKYANAGSVGIIVRSRDHAPRGAASLAQILAQCGIPVDAGLWVDSTYLEANENVKLVVGTRP